MFYNERKEKRGEKTLLCPAVAGPIYNENHTVVMGNSSRPSVKENESLARAAGAFMWSPGPVHRIMLHWSVKKEKKSEYLETGFLFLLLKNPGQETAVL